MKKYVMLILLLISLMLLTFNLNNTKEENNKEISKIEKILSKPAGITAYTLNGEKTDLSYNDLISGYEIDSIACKNGTIATYNNEDNTVSLSNIQMPEYCTIDFKEKTLITLYNKILKDNPKVETRTDFSTVFTATNTGTLYTATEKNVHNTSDTTVYYFSGNATNNWVKFGGYYWRIIRTNADGSIRLLFHGTFHDGKGYLGRSAYWSVDTNPMYSGYMWGIPGTLAKNRNNTVESLIKQYIDNWYDGTRTITNSTYQTTYTDTAGTTTNKLINYADYLSTTAVYCSDRNIGKADYFPYSLTSTFYYAAYYRSKVPTYDCTTPEDAFSASNENAKLKYPIGLMTYDEITYAGGYYGSKNTSAWYYQNSLGESSTGTDYFWTMSPAMWSYESSSSKYTMVFKIGGSTGSGKFSLDTVISPFWVRPVISIKTDVLWSKGDGSPENPYEIVYN